MKGHFFGEKTWQLPECAETFRPMSRELWQRSFMLLAVVLTTTIASAETNAVNSAALVSTNISITPTNLAQLLALPPEQLEKVDIARIDLLLAEGLSSSENLDVEQCLNTLDEWASEVKIETERNYHRFVEHPEKFKNSLGYYRMAVMAAVLCQDLRVHYDPQREKELFENNYFTQSQPYSQSRAAFLFGCKRLFLARAGFGQTIWNVRFDAVFVCGDWPETRLSSVHRWRIHAQLHLL
jgi:hypothetical protein